MKFIDGKLAYRSVKEAAAKFVISMRTANKIWKRGQHSSQDGNQSEDMKSRKLGNVESKRSAKIDLAAVRNITLQMLKSI